MPMSPYVDVNEALSELLAQAQAALGTHFVGMILAGSLALGDFDPKSSDIDFVVVTDDLLSNKHQSALKEMHARFDASASPWAAKVEAVYIPREALRRYIPSSTQYPQVEKERPFFLERLEDGWIFQCYILREHGVALAGPDPRTLIDPVDPDEMRQAVGAIPKMWQNDARNDPTWLEWLAKRGAQAFVVLTLCRLLYTLEVGAVASKPGAARWAQTALDARWTGLIERALAGQHEDSPTLNGDSEATVALVEYTVESFQQWETSQLKSTPK